MPNVLRRWQIEITAVSRTAENNRQKKIKKTLLLPVKAVPISNVRIEQSKYENLPNRWRPSRSLAWFVIVVPMIRCFILMRQALQVARDLFGMTNTIVVTGIGKWKWITVLAIDFTAGIAVVSRRATCHHDRSQRCEPAHPLLSVVHLKLLR